MSCHCRACVGDHAGYGPCTKPMVVFNTEVANELLDVVTATANSGDALALGPQSVKNLHGLLCDLLRLAKLSSDDAIDAAKWRALRNCARITAIGSAGMERPNDPDAHVTLNFWTHNERETEAHPRKWLDTFVKKALALANSPSKTNDEPTRNLMIELRSQIHGCVPDLYDGKSVKAKCVICGNFNRFWYIVNACNFCQSCVREALYDC